jgi:hypothetical protein
MNATHNEHEQVVEEIVRGIFDALPTEGEYREAAEYDLKRLSPVELLHDQLLSAQEFLEGLHNTAEAMGVVAQTIHRDTLERVRDAHSWAAHVAGIY